MMVISLSNVDPDNNGDEDILWNCVDDIFRKGQGDTGEVVVRVVLDDEEEHDDIDTENNAPYRTSKDLHHLALVDIFDIVNEKMINMDIINLRKRVKKCLRRGGNFISQIYEEVLSTHMHIEEKIEWINSTKSDVCIYRNQYRELFLWR